jgi:hypothetical protein
MKIELDTQYLTSEDFSMIFNLAVKAGVREETAKKLGTTPRKTNGFESRRQKSYSKFTEPEVRTIWTEYKNGKSKPAIARLVGRTNKAVSAMIYRMKSGTKLSGAMKKVLSNK